MWSFLSPIVTSVGAKGGIFFGPCVSEIRQIKLEKKSPKFLRLDIFFQNEVDMIRFRNSEMESNFMNNESLQTRIYNIDVVKKLMTLFNEFKIVLKNGSFEYYKFGNDILDREFDEKMGNTEVILFTLSKKLLSLSSELAFYEHKCTMVLLSKYIDEMVLNGWIIIQKTCKDINMGIILKYCCKFDFFFIHYNNEIKADQFIMESLYKKTKFLTDKTYDLMQKLEDKEEESETYRQTIESILNKNSRAMMEYFTKD